MRLQCLHDTEFLLRRLRHSHHVLPVPLSQLLVTKNSPLCYATEEQKAVVELGVPLTQSCLPAKAFSLGAWDQSTSSNSLDSLFSALLKGAFLLAWTVPGSTFTVIHKHQAHNTYCQQSSSGQILQIPACFCAGSSCKRMICVSFNVVHK